MTYFYEPSAGHGLKHDPFNSIVAPRPIGWISSRGANGAINLAPYSFFNAFNYHPPIIGFASVGAKDTLRNAQESGEFTWNLATRALADQMNTTCTPAPYGQSEFDLAGLTQAPCRLVACPRVAESPASFECKVSDIHQLRGHRGDLAQSWLVLGEVVGVHIAEHAVRDGIFDTFRLGIIQRGGGPSAYAELREDARFDMHRPG